MFSSSLYAGIITFNVYIYNIRLKGLKCLNVEPHGLIPACGVAYAAHAVVPHVSARWNLAEAYPPSSLKDYGEIPFPLYPRPYSRGFLRRRVKVL